LDTISSKDRLRIAIFVDRVAGIQLPESKKVLIETRLRKRQKALGVETLKEYVDSVLEQGELSFELIYFLDALTTNKTGFYREAEHFDFLFSYIVSNRLMNNSSYEIWSSGCSSGEEPYTLAIECQELALKYSEFKAQIFATDISVSSLSTARAAIYSHDKIEMMPMEKRKRHLLRSKNKDDQRVMITDRTKAIVKFSEFNLITGDYLPLVNRFNAVFCRNVMIYFSNKDRQRLTESFAQTLVDGGLLFIGHSESLLDKCGQFERLIPTVYRKRNPYHG
jgi:chemotaxis protein methyltransferase CheR